MDRTAANDNVFAFNVTYFPSGQRNLHIVTQILAQAISPTAKFLQGPLLSSSDTTTPSTTLQLVYQAHSVNPGSKPGQSGRRAQRHIGTQRLLPSRFRLGQGGKVARPIRGTYGMLRQRLGPRLLYVARVWCGARRALESSIWYVPLIQTFNLSFFVPSLLVRPQG